MSFTQWPNWYLSMLFSGCDYLTCLERHPFRNVDAHR